MSNRLVTSKHLVHFILFVVLTFYATPGFTGQNEQPKFNEQAPSFTLESLQGEKINLADYRGKIVIIHFATSW